MKVVNLVLSILIALAVICLDAKSSMATDNCNFVKAPKLWVLQASCSTDATIVIPKGVTVDGRVPDGLGGFKNNKITALDPAGGNFVGPILTNGGSVMNVKNLFLRTNLADVCNADADKVVGILLNNASGAISNVNITINKGAGASTCSEGVGIVAQSLPYDSHRSFLKVTVTGSVTTEVDPDTSAISLVHGMVFKDNQLAGLVARGNVFVTVNGALVKSVANSLSEGASDPAQRGIEVSDGAKAYLLNNEILRHVHTGHPEDPAYGIYLRNAGQSTVFLNSIRTNDVGIRVNGGTKVTLKQNTIVTSNYDGILLDDADGIPTTANQVLVNNSQKGLNGIHLQSVNGLVTKNLVKGNIADRNVQNGILSEGSLNKIQSNSAGVINGVNTGLDIVDAGTGNLYSKNACTTSSGPPVNCPVVP